MVCPLMIILTKTPVITNDQIKWIVNSLEFFNPQKYSLTLHDPV